MKASLKLIIITFIAINMTMCNTKQNDKALTTTKKDESFDWLLGNWKRTNEEKGKETFENWIKISNIEYSGIGFTLQNKDTVSKEFMKILETNGKWNLLVKVSDEQEFIKFDMSEIKEDKFDCKNDSLDFPKLIRYWKNGNRINALVSGDSLNLSFEFERIE